MKEKIEMARAIFYNWLEESNDRDRGENDITCRFCDSDWVTYSEWELNAGWRAQHFFEHDDGCPVITAKRILFRGIQEYEED